MNDEINRIGNVYNYFKQKKTVEPIVMFPGSIWDLETEYTKSLSCIDKWNVQYKNLIENPKLVQPQTVPIVKIIEVGSSRIKTLSENEEGSKYFNELPELNVLITDLNKYILVSNKGISEVERLDHQIELSSEVLFYCLKFDWGFNTTHVNGRVQFKENGFLHFVKWEALFNNINHNQEFSTISQWAGQ